MRIPCPYCGERDVREFTYLGDATLERPDPQAPDADRSLHRLRLSARQSGRRAPRALVSRRRLPGLACGRARHAHARDRCRPLLQGGPMSAVDVLPFRRATAASSQRRVDRSIAAVRGFSTAKQSTASPATRLRRRCWPTACVWSAAASSITGRAASSPPGPRSRTRWSNCAAGARREPNTRPRRSSSLTASTRRARTAGRRCAFDLLAVNSLLAPFFLRGLLLQDLHVAGLVLGEGLRAHDPPRRGLGPRRTEPDPDHYEHAYAFCDVLVIGAGAAGLAAALVAARSGARVIVCEEDFIAGGRLLADDREIDGVPEARGPRRLSPNCVLPNVRLMPRTAYSAV